METIKYILSLFIIAMLLTGCKNEIKPEIKTVKVETTKELDSNVTFTKAEFTVEGMTCAIGCAATIEKRITKMEGVKYAKVDFDRKLAMVEYNKAKVNHTLLEKTVTSITDTYKVTDMKTVDTFSTK
ncbi:heavy-metal-associated domain-containing protein [Aestuariivivens sp. NBU2969]|uniref:heavy-metal-associated domain-containing protein n=1 Tax=Aestuariivivens sp. NBU2969 TaxID=2873267 RepID=UPI001CBAE15E|nr:heavy metal-associated domain-containing protein [Aestuariivivens sp. NBU2969]